MKARLALLLVLGSMGLGAADPAPVPRVEAVYPAASTLPANHLKFYIHFSVPMRQGVFLQYCKLRDAQGREDPDGVFRETELWSEDGRRLTLWLHPGRQKTGVNLNTEFGPVLERGGRYSLLISGAWPSADGASSGRDTEKTFDVGPRETQQLDLKQWKIKPPAAGSKHPVEVRFPAPLDHALLLRFLQVLTKEGDAVPGAISTGDSDRVWHFTPAQPWARRPHQLMVNSQLEDLAGNSLARPFEVDLEGPPPAKVAPIVVVPFTPGTTEFRRAGP
jgi:hypothetical protein